MDEGEVVYMTEEATGFQRYVRVFMTEEERAAYLAKNPQALAYDSRIVTTQGTLDVRPEDQDEL